MPEIWLNYGEAEVVLEIRAENLEQIIDSGMVPEDDKAATGTISGKNKGGKETADSTDKGNATEGGTPSANPAAGQRYLEPHDISDILQDMDSAKPFDLVLMHDSQAIRHVVSSLFALCERRSVQFPGILADRHILSGIKTFLPEGSIPDELTVRSLDGRFADDTADDNGNDAHGKAGRRDLIFVAETEFDGLFGYETVATRLLREFGPDEMLTAYTKRERNMPSPGRRTGSFAEATKFADRFEIGAIEIIADTTGITDILVGHPSETGVGAATSRESCSIMDVEHQKTLMVSTGKASSNATLTDAFSSIWNCHAAVRNNGLCILAAECTRGLGSDALRMYIEGRMQPDHLPNPSRYVDGMEEILFLQEVQKRCQVALVSILPEMYTNRLNIISIPSMKRSVEYMQKTQGVRQKASVVIDGSRLLLR